MKLTRLFTAQDGLTYKEEFAIDSGTKFPCASVRFAWARHGETPPPAAVGWHPTPNRRIYLTLQGAAEVELSGDGSRVLINREHPLLAENVTGKGHQVTARPATHEDWIFAVINLEER